MENTITRRISMRTLPVLLALVLFFTAGFSVFGAAPAYAASYYNISSLPVAIKAYPTSTGNDTAAYSSTTSGPKSGTIYASDLCTINSFINNEWMSVTYPTSGGKTRTLYVPRGSFFCNNTYRRASITKYAKAYRRYSGSATIGSVDSSDSLVYVVGDACNGRYQTVYKVTGTNYYKAGWVETGAVRFESSEPAAASIAEGTYVIRSSINYNKAVDVYGANMVNANNVNIYDYNGSKAQIFYIKPVGDGYYAILVNSNRNMALDVHGGTGYSGANVEIYSYHGGNNQLWKFAKVGSYYYIISKSGGFYLDLNGANTSNCTNIQVYNGNQTNAQKWTLQKVTVTSTPVDNNFISEAKLKTAASTYGISTGSNAYAALKLINTKYASRLSSSEKSGVLVFMFEGVGCNSNITARENAMCVVVKNSNIVYINRYSSSIPDCPFTPSKNGGDPMPTIKSGIYSFTTTNHKSSYAALHLTSANVVRFRSTSNWYSSTSSAINIHRKSSDRALPSTASGSPNSAGCQLVGKAGTSSSSQYAKFIQAVGIVNSGDAATCKYRRAVSGKYIVDRTYAASYMRNIGYSDSAIKAIG